VESASTTDGTCSARAAACTPLSVRRPQPQPSLQCITPARPHVSEASALQQAASGVIQPAAMAVIRRPPPDACALPAARSSARSRSAAAAGRRLHDGPPLPGCGAAWHPGRSMPACNHCAQHSRAGQGALPITRQRPLVCGAQWWRNRQRGRRQCSEARASWCSTQLDGPHAALLLDHNKCLAG
jgi:hypothetical protein